MQILISFCNAGYYPHLAAQNLSPFGVFDTVTGQLILVKLPDQLQCSGITGLTQNEQYIFLFYQAEHSGVVVYDKNGFDIVYTAELPQLLDPHSAVVMNDAIFVVSTGKDQVLRYTLQDSSILDPSSVTVVWQAPDSEGNSDTHHLNGLYLEGQRLYVSGFGLKAGELKSTATQGYIFDITEQHKLITPIYQPHAVVKKGDDWWYCESASRSVCRNHERVLKLTEGYVRGLMLLDQTMILGTSTGRVKSKSTGQTLTQDDSGLLQKTCRLLCWQYAHEPTAATACGQLLQAIQHQQCYFFDLHPLFDEIYEVVPVLGEVKIHPEQTASIHHLTRHSPVSMIDWSIYSEQLVSATEKQQGKKEVLLSNLFQVFTEELDRKEQTLQQTKQAHREQQLRQTALREHERVTHTQREQQLISQIALQKSELRHLRQETAQATLLLSEQQRLITELQNVLELIKGSKTFRTWQQFVKVKQLVVKPQRQKEIKK